MFSKKGRKQDILKFKKIIKARDLVSSPVSLNILSSKLSTVNTINGDCFHTWQ